MSKKTKLHDFEPSLKYDSKQKRDNKRQIRIVIIVVIVLALLTFVAHRLFAEALCVKQSKGFYIHDKCQNTEKCCVSVKWNVKYLSTTL